MQGTTLDSQTIRERIAELENYAGRTYWGHSAIAKTLGTLRADLAALEGLEAGVRVSVPYVEPAERRINGRVVWAAGEVVRVGWTGLVEVVLDNGERVHARPERVEREAV